MTRTSVADEQPGLSEIHLRDEALDEADGVAVPAPAPPAGPAAAEVEGLDAEVELVDGVLDLEGDLPGLAQPEQEQLAGAAAALAVGPADERLQVGQLPAQHPDLGVDAQQRRRLRRRQLAQLRHHPRHPRVRHGGRPAPACPSDTVTLSACAHWHERSEACWWTGPGLRGGRWTRSGTDMDKLKDRTELAALAWRDSIIGPFRRWRPDAKTLEYWTTTLAECHNEN